MSVTKSLKLGHGRAHASLTVSCAVVALVLPAAAQEAVKLPDMPLAGTAEPTGPVSGETVESARLSTKSASVRDLAQLLKDLPGIDAYTGGGISSLPVMHGLADDRINVLTNGMPSAQACSNHMNSPLSYVNVAAASSIEVLSGLTPVSAGGDSIAGTILVETQTPVFAADDNGLIAQGSAAAFYQSNGHGNGISGTATIASRKLSASLFGSWTQSDNYEAGDGSEVTSTEFASADVGLTLAARNDDGHLLELKVTHQHVPYQAFVNQYMDMTDNDQTAINGRYEGGFDWGTIEARAYWQRIRHAMDKLDDKPGEMPMNTKSMAIGGTLMAEIDVTQRDVLRLGGEAHHLKLDDWWPPVDGSMMMSPLTYWNINNGKRDRFAAYAEWDATWSAAWFTQLGVRGEHVRMNTGDVQPYSYMGMMNAPDANAANAFNAVSHQRSDTNFDLTAIIRYSPTADQIYEAGYARKTRSPNLYERYSWGRGSMSSRMIGWFGDLNGYVGDLDLKPETADILMLTARWRDAANDRWQLKTTVHVTWVDDYIDADKVKDFTNMAGSPTGFSQFQFANHDARLYGLDVSGHVVVADTADIGRFTLRGSASWLRGERQDTDDSLYHMMPLHGLFTLEHKLGAWESTVEVEAVDRKSRVDAARHEPETDGYVLVHLRTAVTVTSGVRLNVAVRNLFDRAYDLPLGGAYFAQRAMGAQPVPGSGRSFDGGLVVEF